MLVLSKKGTRLYDEVQKSIRTHLKHIVDNDLAPICNKLVSMYGSGATVVDRRDTGNFYMLCIRNVWNDHMLCMNRISNVLLYMVRIDFVLDVVDWARI
jgi:hypothetical protein